MISTALRGWESRPAALCVGSSISVPSPSRTRSSWCVTHHIRSSTSRTPADSSFDHRGARPPIWARRLDLADVAIPDGGDDSRKQTDPYEPDHAARPRSVRRLPLPHQRPVCEVRNRDRHAYVLGDSDRRAGRRNFPGKFRRSCRSARQAPPYAGNSVGNNQKPASALS